MDAKGKGVMESILETKATTILEFLAGLRGTLSVTFEEGIWAAWLYDLLKPRVANCDIRKRRFSPSPNGPRLTSRLSWSLPPTSEVGSPIHFEGLIRLELKLSYRFSCATVACGRTGAADCWRLPAESPGCAVSRENVKAQSNASPVIRLIDILLFIPEYVKNAGKKVKHLQKKKTVAGRVVWGCGFAKGATTWVVGQSD
jgi:hypothetical protein